MFDFLEQEDGLKKTFVVFAVLAGVSLGLCGVQLVGAAIFKNGLFDYLAWLGILEIVCFLVGLGGMVVSGIVLFIRFIVRAGSGD